MTNPARPGGTNPTGPDNSPRQPVTPRPRVPVPSQPRPEVDLATRLDGQRGWLNELDRSLRKRSIIALFLTCLAVGVGAAALYISLTKNSDADRIDALETRIEAVEAAAAAGGISPTTEPETSVPDTALPEIAAPDAVVPETGVTGSGTTTPPGQ
jgi:hypothetical protein